MYDRPNSEDDHPNPFILSPRFKPKTVPVSSRLVRARTRVIRVLVIEDDEAMIPIFAAGLQFALPGSAFDWTTSSLEALHKMRYQNYDLVVADYFLDGSESGMDFWRTCHQTAPETPVILTSAMSVDKFVGSWDGVRRCPPFLPKPFSAHQFKNVVRATLLGGFGI